MPSYRSANISLHLGHDKLSLPPPPISHKTQQSLRFRPPPRRASADVKNGAEISPCGRCGRVRGDFPQCAQILRTVEMSQNITYHT